MATNLTLGTLFTADVNNILNGISQIKSALASVNQTFSQINSGSTAMGTGMANAINKTTAAINKQNQALAQSKTQLTGLAGMWQRVQSAMKTSLAYGTAGAAIYTIIDGLRQGVTAVVEYDQALKNLQAITQATDAEMVGLADTIKSVSSKYIYSTKEISDGAVLMGQAGFTATQTMQAMDSAAKLAMGTLEDMSLTVDLLTTTIVAFNMKTVESERVADVMANAMNRSKLTLDKLRVAFNYVGNIAHEAGISLEETAAAMSVLSNAGMRASTIGTSLRQVLQNILAPNRRLREEFQGLGIDLSQLDPKIVGFSGVLNNLRRILIDQKTGLVDMTKAYNLFGLRAAQAAAILARSAEDAYPRMLAMMYEVGAASEMANKQMEGLIARFKNVAANAQLIAIAIGEGGLFGVLRALVDILSLVTKALKSFFESDIGQLTASWVAWTAAISAAIVVGKVFVAFIAGSMIPALMSWIKYIRDTIIVMTALQGVSVVSKINMFLSAIVNGGPILLAYAAAAAAITTAFHYWRDAEENQIKTITRSSNAYKTAVDTLDAYLEIFIKLRERQKQGQNIDVEYEAAVKRLIRALPQLKGVIDDNTGALEDNIKKIIELKNAGLDKYVEQQMELIRRYDKQLAESKGLKEFTGEWTKFATGLSRIDKDLVQTEESFYNLGGAIASTTDEIVDSFGRTVKADEDVEEQSKKTVAAMKGRDAAWVATALAYKQAGFAVDMIIEKLKALGASAADIKLAQDAMKSFKDEISKDAEDIASALANMPHAFTPFFNSLDAMAKVSFAKAVRAMEGEVSQYKKIADAILKTEEDRYAAEAFIRTKHLMKFADDVLKEKVTSEQLLAFKKNLIEEEKKLVLQRIDEWRVAAQKTYEAEMATAADNAKKKEEAQEKFTKRMIELRKMETQAIIAIEQGGNAQIVEAYKKTADEVVKTGQKMADDYLREMQRMVDETKKKIESLKKARQKSEENLNDKIRNLRQKSMTDAQKFADDEARVNELIGSAREATTKGNYDSAKEYYDKAADWSEKLSRSIMDDQGRIISNEEDNTRKSISYLQKIKDESTDLYNLQIKQEEEKLQKAKDLMSDINTLMLSYGTEWDKLNQTKLKNFISALNDIINRTETLSEKTSNIRSDWEAITGKLKAMPKPTEPSLGAQAGLEAVKKKEGAGTITVGGKTYAVEDLAEGTGTITAGGKTFAVGGEREGEGIISFGGKTYNVKDLAEYEKKVTEISDKVQEAVQKSQETVVTGAQTSGEETLETVGAVGEKVTKAVSDASAGVETAQQSAEAAQTSMIDMASKAGEVATSVMGINNEFVTMGFNIETVKNALTTVRDIIVELIAKPFEIITQTTLDRLNEARDIVLEIKENWDEINSKDIDLNINVNYNYPSGGGGGTPDFGGGFGPSNVESYESAKEDFGGGYSQTLRYGGIVIKGIKSAFQSLQRYAGGGKLPGYGGGDKQIVAAEAGEFIVNKESTSKFRPLIEAINSDSIANLGKRFGGIIKSLPAFKGGGQVFQNEQRIGRANMYATQPITINISPTYMSGDKATARRFAMEIQRELDDLQKRRGRR